MTETNDMFLETKFSRPQESISRLGHILVDYKDWSVN